MQNTILDRHIVTTILGERAVGNGVDAGESILTTELIKRGGNLLDAAGILRDVYDSSLFSSAISDPAPP